METNEIRKKQNVDLSLSPEELVESLEKSYERSTAIEEASKNIISRRMEKIGIHRKKAEDAFADFSLSRLSRKQQEHVTYVRQQDIKSHIEDNGFFLQEIQKKIFSSDFDLIKNNKNKKGFSLAVIENELKELNLSRNADGTIEGEIQYKDFNAYLSRKLQNQDISRQTKLPCEIENEADHILKDSTSQSDTSAEPINDQVDGHQDEQEDQFNLQGMPDLSIEKQMKHATSPEEPLRYGVGDRAKSGEITKDLGKLHLKGGPADVTAYHDFYDLQIGFRHVWTELFDEKVPELGKTIYEILAKVEDYDPEDGNNLTNDNQLASNTDLLIENAKKKIIEVAKKDERYQKVIVELLPEITVLEWSLLDEEGKNIVFDWAVRLEKLHSLQEAYNNDAGMGGAPTSDQTYLIKDLKEKAKLFYRQIRLLNDVRKSSIASNSSSNLESSNALNIINEFEDRLKEKHTFDIFVPDSINYGLLVTYHQEWEPKDYQVGELVSTIPLAPKETRKYSKKRIVKKSRTEKEIENSLQFKKDDASDTYRHNAEIVRKANNKTSFTHNAEFGMSFLVKNAKGNHGLFIDSAKNSSQIKKEFRQAVVKSAQEYKNENRVEISSSLEEEFEEMETGEIGNPNDEIPVTYLFYELQRRYEISEKIKKITPVIFIANDVPRPDEIDEVWLLSHDWILRRVILDDSYLMALDYLSDRFVGDETSLQTLRENYETQRSVVEKVTQAIESHSGVLNEYRSKMEYAIDNYASAQNDGGGGLFAGIGSFLFGDGGNNSETYRIRMEAAKEAFQRAERENTRLRSQLTQEITALESAATKYNDALARHHNYHLHIKKLRSHVKENILYYMQAIWDHEPSDQRYFRLYDKEALVPDFDAIIEKNNSNNDALEVIIIGNAFKAFNKKIIEIADIDNPLGYKGNYAIYPLKKSNTLTTYMMQDYVTIHEVAELSDPDESANMTIDQIRKMIRCEAQKRPEGLKDKVKEYYRDLLIKKLKNPTPEKEEITAPTDSLYIEALPGSHPILEDFKLVHRAVDVKKAQAEVRHDELENIRYASRIKIGDYDDPDIEQKIMVEGQEAAINVNPND